MGEERVKNCSNCLWLNEIDKKNNHYGCSNNEYFSLYLKINKKGIWVRKVKEKYYFIGICKGHKLNTLSNQIKLFKQIIE